MTRSAAAYWSDRRRAGLARRPGACRPVVEGFTRAGLLVLLAGAVAGPALAQPTEVGKIADSGLATEDRFGQAVAIGGGLAVAGAPFEDGSFLNTGAAYVYREIAGTWALETPLAVTTGQSKDDWFGAAVATDGQIVAVGAPKFDTSFIDDGAVYVYRFSLTTGWSLEQKVTAPDPGTGDQFGAAVAIVGNALLIGAPGDDGKGSAYVFRYNGVSSWGFEAKLQSATATAGAQFGASLDGASLDGLGDRALIGAPLQSDGGAVWVFDQVGSVWTESAAVLTSGDTAGDEQFGSSIAFDGTKVLIGAHLDDQLVGGANMPNAGAAYVFEWDGAAWTEEAKLTAGTDASGQANFGFSGDLAAGTAVVGAFQAHTTAGQFTGAAYVFRFSGTAWARESVIAASDAAAGAGDLFGYAIDGIDTVMIGAPGDEPINTTKSATGSAYFYTLGAAPDPVDTDGDGLLDSTEIDSASGSGCPDPTVFDSDGDTLSDGDEVLNLLTNPCSSDTDGDGVPDNLDPTPTIPGETGEWLEAEAHLLAEVIEAMALGEFNGPNGNANKGRRNSLTNRVRNAAKAISRGDYAEAIDILEGVLDKVDGVEPEPDWMNAGPAQEQLATDLTVLIALLLYG